MPTVDHLFMLSKLLGVHMEKLLVEQEDEKHFTYICLDMADRIRMLNAKTKIDDRILLYNQRISLII